MPVHRPADRPLGDLRQGLLTASAARNGSAQRVCAALTLPVGTVMVFAVGPDAAVRTQSDREQGRGGGQLSCAGSCCFSVL